MSEFDAAVASVIRLIGTAPLEQRVRVADWIGRSIATHAPAGLDGQALEQMLAALCQDSELGVRRAIARHVLHSPRLPPSVVQRLAHDVESISIPFIRFSEAMTDTDLLGVVGENDTLRQISVARRARVSQAIAHALVECRKTQVVKTVIANAGADIHESDLVQVLDLFGGVDSVTTLLANRPYLPAEISRRVVSLQAELGTRQVRYQAARRARLTNSRLHWLAKS